MSDKLFVNKGMGEMKEVPFSFGYRVLLRTGEVQNSFDLSTQLDLCRQTGKVFYYYDDGVGQLKMTTEVLGTLPDYAIVYTLSSE